MDYLARLKLLRKLCLFMTISPLVIVSLLGRKNSISQEHRIFHVLLQDLQKMLQDLLKDVSSPVLQKKC